MRTPVFATNATHATDATNATNATHAHATNATHLNHAREDDPSALCTNVTFFTDGTEPSFVLAHDFAAWMSKTERRLAVINSKLTPDSAAVLKEHEEVNSELEDLKKATAGERKRFGKKVVMKMNSVNSHVTILEFLQGGRLGE
jgi:hypothetical protein